MATEFIFPSFVSYEGYHPCFASSALIVFLARFYHLLRIGRSATATRKTYIGTLPRNREVLRSRSVSGRSLYCDLKANEVRTGSRKTTPARLWRKALCLDPPGIICHVKSDFLNRQLSLFGRVSCLPPHIVMLPCVQCKPIQSQAHSHAYGEGRRRVHGTAAVARKNRQASEFPLAM